MSNPFDYVNSILQDKKYLIVDDVTEHNYNPFLTNRALSYHIDTLSFADDMNRAHFIDKKLQYDYLINIVRPLKRRKSKWAKRGEDEDIKLIQTYYGYNYNRAREVMSILSPENLLEIKKKLEKGGV